MAAMERGEKTLGGSKLLLLLLLEEPFLFWLFTG